MKAQFRSGEEHRYEEAPTIYFTVSSEGTILSVNSFGADQLGYLLEELVGQPILQVFFDEDRPTVQHQLAECWRHPQDPRRWQARMIRKDGRLVRGKNTVRVVTFAHNQPTLLILCENPTERKGMEDGVRAIAENAAFLTGKEFFRFLVKTLAKCLNAKYAFLTECTDSCSKQTLRTLALWDGTGFVDNFDYALANTPCSKVIGGEVCFYGQGVQRHFPHNENLKSLKVKSYLGHPLFSQSGKILGHLVVMDTQALSTESDGIPIIKLFASHAAAELERSQAEIALQKREECLRRLVDLIPQLVFAKNKEGRFIFCNKSTANVYGTTVKSLIGKTDADFGLPESQVNQSRKDDLEVMDSGKIKVINEEQITDASGKLHYLHTTKIPFVFSDTNLPSVLGVSTDITEQKMVESQLRASYERTRDLTTRLAAVEESERKRIARELHDEFGQMLTGLKLDTAWLNRHLAKEEGIASPRLYLDKLKAMSSLLDQTIQSVRRIATSLRPSALDDLGLIPALEWQAQEFQKRTGVPCEVTTTPLMMKTVVDTDRATALFRIAQELLTNIMRHAEASKVKLDLRQEDHSVILTIQDNGRGIAQRQIEQGASLGLLGIKERITPFDGRFQIRGEPGKGTRVTVLIPLP